MARPSDDLVQVDDSINRLIRTVRRPGYRQRILRGVERIPTANALRLLRSIEIREDGGGAPSVGDVAADLEVEQSTASRALTVLVERGLLTRGAHPADARRVHLSLTPDGREALMRATSNRLDVLAEVVDEWDDTELAVFERLLARFVDRYEQIDDADGS